MKKQQIIGLAFAVLALGGIGYFSYTMFFKKPKPVDDNTNPTDPNSNTNTKDEHTALPPSVVTPTDAPIAVNAKVNAVRKAGMYTGAGRNTKYTAGGTDKKGNIDARNYAGKVLEINKTFNTAKLQNFEHAAETYNTFSANDEYNTFWMSISDLVAQTPL